MSNLWIGRVGLDIEGKTWRALSDNGDTVTVSGQLANPTSTDPVEALAACRTLRRQLLGYVGNRDELAVPMVPQLDPYYTGLYRVLAARVDTDRPGEAAAHLQFDGVLQRIAERGGVSIESTFSGPVRPNAHSITDSDVHGWHAVPAATLAYETIPPLALGQSTVGVAGGVDLYRWSEDPASLFAGGRVGWALAPERWYEGACTITDGEAAAPLVGRTVAAFSSSSQLLRVSNDRIRFTFYGHPADVDEEWASDLLYDVEYWNGAEWDDEFGQAAIIEDIDTPEAVNYAPWGYTILRNEPACVAARIHYSNRDTPNRALHLDIILRRGSTYAEFFMRSTDEAEWVVGTSALVSPSSVTGGSSTESSGDALVIATPRAFTIPAGNLTELDAAADTYPFAVGVVLNPSDAADVVLEYHQATTEQVEVVAT